MSVDSGAGEHEPIRSLEERRKQLPDYVLATMLGAAAAGTGQLRGDAQAASSAYHLLLERGPLWMEDPEDARGVAFQDYANRLFEVMHFTPPGEETR